MPPAEGPRDDEARLSGARAEFVGSLPRRLDALRGALQSAEQAPADADRMNGLLRRVHAVGSAARVLGFASVAEALAEAERHVRKARTDKQTAPFAEVARALDLLPSLVLGAPVSARAPEREKGAPVVFPISVLVLGSAALAEALSAGAGTAPIESERTDDAERALELAHMIGPDVAVVDGDHPGSRDLITAMLSDPLIEPLPIVVVGSFENPETTRNFVELGADRVLPKPCSPDTLRRTVEELRERVTRPRGSGEPLGDLTVPALAERIAGEFKRGLVDALETGSPNAPVALGEGHDVLAAVWGAVARVRELVTLRSSGGVRFEPSGPEGAVPIVPWGSSERRAGERGVRSAREGSGVSLQGRRLVVADDDPAVVWFMSGLLKAVGVEVLEAHDGRRALEQTFDAWPDVVVSDVLMPKLDGFSLCHEIKRDVVVRDTPVILLSWKEDLLQRVRELGGSADGYLRKEAAASAVVERVREVLRARGRVEDRIHSGGEVRGRLDGITPRLVLALACREEGDVRVSVRDAAFLFEAMVRRGQLVSVTRSSQDGSFARGAEVLPSLLGATAGRFVVTPDDSACRAELHGSLAELLKLPVERARKSLQAVSASSLVRLARLELERPLVEAYLASTPEPAATLMRRLLAGDRVKDLVLEGTPSSLLEAVLSDIARRGGVHVAELDPVAERSDPPPPRWEPPVATVLTATATTPSAPPLEVSVPGPDAAPAEAPPENLAFSKTLENPPFRVSGPDATLPLSAAVTPSLDTASVGVTSATIPDARTLEGMGDLARVTARDPRPPESSSPELIAEEVNEDVLGLFAEAEASSAPSMSPLVPTVRAEPQHGSGGQSVTPAPIVTPAPAATPAESPAAKTSTPPFAASAAKTLMSHAPERIPKTAREQATVPPTSRIGKKSGPRKGKAPPSEAAASSWGIVMLKGLVAFAVAFGFTSWVLIPVLSPAPAPADTDASAPNPSASSSSGTTEPAAAPGADAER
jgi:DNA-binding response OmpR family regulator/HPt (histidine-containing phosphotransfer) domain-containing protein